MNLSQCCVLFTKPARAGRVKTRLIGVLSASEAAELHAAFVEDLLARLSNRSFDLQIAWALEEDETVPQNSSAESFRQHGEDLGERLLGALRRVGRLHGKVAAVGSDHPELPVEALDEAFAQLDDHQVVIGPARDGGYYLIALRSDSLTRKIFSGIEWSTERVLEQTLERCAEADLTVSLLPAGDDVDSPQDLERLKLFLSREVHDCRHTETLLREWGMLS